jgi:prepilin-type N-terminal cleavage/methylation domain
MKMKNGFTLIELIIVLAIMTILGAIAVPNFLNTSAKARLKADIQSARVINDAKDLYENETGDILNTTATEIIKTLFDNGYLKKEYVSQTNSAVWQFEDKIIKVNITGCDESVKNLYSGLNDDEKLYIKNGS